MNERISGVAVRRATAAEAASALNTGGVRAFIILLEETDGENIVALANPSLPHELVVQLIETFLQREPGTMEDNSFRNN
jgi:hypothetical protein